MRKSRLLLAIIAVVVVLMITLLLVACESAQLPLQAGIGPNPTLPKPNHTLIPTVKVAPAVGWANGESPVAAPGFAVRVFANGLEHPRWLYVLPNGDVLVAETNAPPKPEDGKGLKGWFFKHFQKKAGAAVPSANRITVLRDTNGDGVAEQRSILLRGLNSPFGMTLIGNNLYVADSDALLRFPYSEGATVITVPGVKVVDLPAGPLNHHWTKNVIASRDGSRLYVTVGSNSNVAENGIEKEENRAAIWEVDPSNGHWRLFATGLRNANGLAWNPDSGALWAAVNERDEIGSDLVPDYITSVRDGGFYGWPYSYYGQHVDVRAKPPRPDLVAKAIVPDFAVGPHTASLGLTFYEGSLLPAAYHNGAFVGQHGSWNRNPRSGYRVIFVPFSGGKPSGDVQEILTGFVDAKGDAHGRPVGVVVDKSGALLVADDVGNTVWRVTPR